MHHTGAETVKSRNTRRIEGDFRLAVEEEVDRCQRIRASDVLPYVESAGGDSGSGHRRAVLVGQNTGRRDPCGEIRLECQKADVGMARVLNIVQEDSGSRSTGRRL